MTSSKINYKIVMEKHGYGVYRKALEPAYNRPTWGWDYVGESAFLFIAKYLAKRDARRKKKEKLLELYAPLYVSY